MKYNIGDTVYLVRSGTIHNKTISNSVSVFPAKVEGIANEMLLIEISTISKQDILMEVRESEVQPTIAKALEEIQQSLSVNTKTDTNES